MLRDRETVTLDEAINNSLSPDRTPPNEREYFLRIQPTHSYQEAEYAFVAIDVNDKSSEISRYIKTQEKVLSNYIANPNLINIPKRGAHGMRSKREQGDIRESRIREYKFELAVLRGDIKSPITFFKEGASISGYSISRESIDL